MIDTCLVLFTLHCAVIYYHLPYRLNQTHEIVNHIVKRKNERILDAAISNITTYYEGFTFLISSSKAFSRYLYLLMSLLKTCNHRVDSDIMSQVTIRTLI